MSSKCLKHIVHLGLGFGEKLLWKDNLQLMNVLIKFLDREPRIYFIHNSYVEVS
jgi:hypothetical protein